MEQIKSFLHMSWLNFKGQRAAFDFEEFILLEVAYPFFTIIFYCVLARYTYSEENIVSWIIGNSFLMCTNICVFSLGACFLGERYFGRIRSIMVGSKSKIVIILEKGLFSCLIGVFATLIGFCMGCVVFGVSLANIPWGMFLISIFVTMFSFTGFGLLLSVFGLVSDSINFILNFMEYILLLFTGANIPIEQYPYPVRTISYMLPMTRGIKAIRGYIAGRDLEYCMHLLFSEMLLGIMYFLLAAIIVKWVEKIAIKNGRLELF